MKYLPDFGVDWELSIVQSNNVYLQEILQDKEVLPIRKSYASVRPLFFSYELGAKWCTLLDRLRISRTAESLNKEKSLSSLKKSHFDVFHPTYFNPYFLDKLAGKPFVLTVHDLIPERYPEFFHPNDIQIQGRKKLIDKASAIVTVSENTKRDLIELYHVPENLISVIYHGGPDLCPFTVRTDKEHPFFLFVGARGAYKRFDSFIQAFSVFSKKYPEVSVICTGKPFSNQELSLLDSLSITGKVQALRVTEKELTDLYQKALALVYPSEYEGFGMPILEAFANRCPVLTYPSSSLSEVGGVAAIYLEKDYRDFYDRLEQLYIMSDSDRDVITSQGAERLSMFSWRRAAELYADVYLSLV